jgi:hypothetical protein
MSNAYPCNILLRLYLAHTMSVCRRKIEHTPSFHANKCIDLKCITRDLLPNHQARVKILTDAFMQIAPVGRLVVNVAFIPDAVARIIAEFAVGTFLSAVRSIQHDIRLWLPFLIRPRNNLWPLMCIQQIEAKNNNGVVYAIINRSRDRTSSAFQTKTDDFIDFTSDVGANTLRQQLFPLRPNECVFVRRYRVETTASEHNEQTADASNNVLSSLLLQQQGTWLCSLYDIRRLAATITSNSIHRGGREITHVPADMRQCMLANLDAASDPVWVLHHHRDTRHIQGLWTICISLLSILILTFVWHKDPDFVHLRMWFENATACHSNKFSWVFGTSRSLLVVSPAKAATMSLCLLLHSAFLLGTLFVHVLSGANAAQVGWFRLSIAFMVRERSSFVAFCHYTFVKYTSISLVVMIGLCLTWVVPLYLHTDEITTVCNCEE